LPLAAATSNTIAPSPTEAGKFPQLGEHIEILLIRKYGEGYSVSFASESFGAATGFVPSSIVQSMQSFLAPGSAGSPHFLQLPLPETGAAKLHFIRFLPWALRPLSCVYRSYDIVDSLQCLPPQSIDTTFIRVQNSGALRLSTYIE
jgi:hypothetical protein